MNQIEAFGNTVVYDIGINTSAIPVFEGHGEDFKAIFSEELDENDMPEQRHSHGQYFCAAPASYQGEIKPQMMCFGFRYFSVTGNAAVKNVLTVCADVKDTSSFYCEDTTLNVSLPKEIVAEIILTVLCAWITSKWIVTCRHLSKPTL